MEDQLSQRLPLALASASIGLLVLTVITTGTNIGRIPFWIAGILRDAWRYLFQSGKSEVPPDPYHPLTAVPTGCQALYMVVDKELIATPEQLDQNCLNGHAFQSLPLAVEMAESYRQYSVVLRVLIPDDALTAMQLKRRRQFIQASADSLFFTHAGMRTLKRKMTGVELAWSWRDESVA